MTKRKTDIWGHVLLVRRFCFAFSFLSVVEEKEMWQVANDGCLV